MEMEVYKMKWMKWKWKFIKDISIDATDKTQG